MKRAGGALWMVGVAGLTLSGPAAGINFVVPFPQDLPDVIPGNGVCDVVGISYPSPPAPPPTTVTCTLRAAIMESNASAGSDLITLASAWFSIRIVGAGEDEGATGDLDLLGSVSMAPSLPDTVVVVSGAGLDRVFDVHPGANVSLQLVHLRDGFVVSEGGAGIRNRGQLSLTDCVITDNEATDTADTLTGAGGGIDNFGTEAGEARLSVERCDIAYNAASLGGGLHLAHRVLSPGAVATLRDVRVRNNEALEVLASGGFTRGGAGGGIHIGSFAELTIVASSITRNTADSNGGGLRAIGGSFARAVNSTLSENRSLGGAGGGVDAVSSVPGEFVNVTIAANESKFGGGGLHSLPDAMHIERSVLADNLAGSVVVAPSDCSGTVDSRGYNLVQDLGSNCTVTSAIGDLIGFEARLASLDNNGGPTHTHLPLPGSAAIDSGPETGCLFPGGGELAVDQRGEPRPQDGDGDGTAICDRGSVEVPEPDRGLLRGVGALVVGWLSLRRLPRRGD
ncbi:MAG: choice-of-anchor Q domain-containing protein [Myxococcota bacterium]|nr:choice-of-anchor Q domain-containing protein [Myxococcota bacterium]